MERINLLTAENAPEKSREILEGISKGGQRLINIIKVMANSSAVLKMFFGISKALEEKTLDSAIAERIGIQLAVMNGCDYCLAAHSYTGSKILSAEEVSLSRKGRSSEPQAQAALDFASAVMKKAGEVSDEEFTKARQAGFSDAELLEIVAIVSLNFFTNAINGVAQTKVDFPKPKE